MTCSQPLSEPYPAVNCRSTWRMASSIFQVCSGMRERFVVGHPLIDPLLGGNHRAMAAAAEERADLAQGGPRVLPRQPHGQHPRLADAAGLAVGLQGLGFQAEDLANRLLDVGKPHHAGVVPDHFAQRLFGQGNRDLLPRGLARGLQAAEGPGKLAGVSRQPRRPRTAARRQAIRSPNAATNRPTIPNRVV